jgi:hypothetical protein
VVAPQSLEKTTAFSEPDGDVTDCEISLPHMSLQPARTTATKSGTNNCGFMLFSSNVSNKALRKSEALEQSRERSERT